MLIGAHPVKQAPPRSHDLKCLLSKMRITHDHDYVHVFTDFKGETSHAKQITFENLKIELHHE